MVKKFIAAVLLNLSAAQAFAEETDMRIAFARAIYLDPQSGDLVLQHRILSDQSRSLEGGEQPAIICRDVATRISLIAGQGLLGVECFNQNNQKLAKANCRSIDTEDLSGMSCWSEAVKKDKKVPTPRTPAI